MTVAWLTTIRVGLTLNWHWWGQAWLTAMGVSIPSHDCGWVCRVNDCGLTDRDLGGYVVSMTVASLTVPYQSRDCVYNWYRLTTTTRARYRHLLFFMNSCQSNTHNSTHCPALCNAFFGSIIKRYLNGQKVVIKNKWYHHMLVFCSGDQWLVESQLETTLFAWSVGQVEFTTHNYERRAVQGIDTR